MTHYLLYLLKDAQQNCAYLLSNGLYNHIMSRDMSKPTMWLCAQRRLRSAWASAQSDQSLRCPHEESLGP